MSSTRSFVEVALRRLRLERLMPAWLAAAALLSLAACSSSHPLVLATFDGGAITPGDLEERPGTTSTAELVDWVEAQAVEAAERRIVLSLAERQGLTADPALRLRAKTTVAVDLALRRIERGCSEGGGMSAAAPVPREWIQVHRLVRALKPTTTSEERESARTDLVIASEAWRRGADVASLASQYTSKREKVVTRIYPDSALDPTLMRTARELADGEVSDVIRTRRGFEVIRRVGSGVSPAPRFQRASDSLREALRQIRLAACPEVMAHIEREAASPDRAVALSHDAPDGASLSIGAEIFDRSALARLAETESSLDALAEEIELAFRLAEGSVSDAARLRLDEEELQRLATLEALVRARRSFLEQSSTKEIAAYLDREGGPDSGPVSETQLADLLAGASAALDREVLDRLREASGFRLDRQAVLVYARSLVP